MDHLKRLLPYLAAIVAYFYLLPLLGRDTGSFILILVFAVPLFCLLTGMLYGARHGFDMLYPVIVGLLFIPSIFIYYNSTAWVYILIYAVISFVGTLAGSQLVRRRK
jgi:multisubunit Na+/H+ antiporter MnhF subunit